MREPGTPRRVFVVDDHAILRRGVRALVESLEGLEWCGEADTPDAKAVRDAAPDLVIADLSFQGNSSLDFVRRVSAEGTPVLVLSMHDERLFAERALAAGARAYVMKHVATEDLEAAIMSVLAGRVWLSEAMTQRVISAAVAGRADGKDPLTRLTDRELEVFELIGRGLRTTEIATRLSLSVKTIESHQAHIKEKLSLSSGTELTRAAVSWAHVL